MTAIPSDRPVRATCHCGASELALDLPDGLVDPRRCTCSYCRRRGAVAVSVPLDRLHVVQGAALTLYRFNTGTALHWFCSVCGIYTHHRRRSDPSQYGVNAACIEGVLPHQLEPVPWVDGINHPADRGA